VKKCYTKKMKTKILYVCAVAFFLAPVFVYAGPIVRSGEVISIDASQVLKNDFYGLGSKVSISGAAEHDVYIAGGTVTINASIAEDLTILGGAVHIHGDVGDDVRVIGGEVTLAKEVKGDVVVMGGILTILSTARVEGDILFFGGSLVVEGAVKGNINGTADTARINTEVGGDVVLKIGSLFTLGDKARILGSVTYESRNDIIRAQNAEVIGNIRKNDIGIDTGSNFLNMYLITVAGILFAAGALYFIARKHMQQIVSRSTEAPGISGLIGLGVFLAVPIIGSVLLVSVIGLLVGVALLAMYVTLCMVAVISASMFIGHLVERVILKSNVISLRTIGIGAILFSFVGLVPFIGGMLLFASIIIMLGTLSQALYTAICK